MLYLSLRQFEYVTAVARAGSLSGAAVQLNVSQPSLSVALTQVEDYLGYKLFVRRKGAPITLTAAGEAYVDKVEDLLAMARRLEDPDLMRHAVSGRLTVGMFDGLAPFHLGPVLKALATRLPAVDIRYRVSDFATLAREMLDGRIDLAVTYDLGLDASFSKSHLVDARPHAQLAGDHPMAGKSRIALRDLAGESLILSEEGLSIRHVLGLFQRLKLRPLVTHRVASVELMRSLVGNAMGVGISYCVPPATRSYDGKPVSSIAIDDDFAVEPVIIARNGLDLPNELVTQAHAAIAGVLIQ